MLPAFRITGWDNNWGAAVGRDLIHSYPPWVYQNKHSFVVGADGAMSSAKKHVARSKDIGVLLLTLPCDLG